jgi:hypothetical protein
MCPESHWVRTFHGDNAAADSSVEEEGEETVGKEKGHNSQLHARGMHQDLHQIKSSKGPSENAHRGEALCVQLEGVRLEVCEVGRADASLQKAHGRQAVPVSAV